MIFMRFIRLRHGIDCLQKFWPNSMNVRYAGRITDTVRPK